jgi:hypothetical protein
MRRAWLVAAVIATGCAGPPQHPGDEAIDGILVEAEMYPVAPADEVIRWHPTLEAAKAASREDGKPIMLFFEFDA